MWTQANNIVEVYARSRQVSRRLLPHGPVDLVRQIALFAAAYYVYRLTRGFADDPAAATTAFANARDLIDIERTLHVFVEPSVQTFVSGERWLMDIAAWLYINAQTSVTLGLVVLIGVPLLMLGVAPLLGPLQRRAAHQRHLMGHLSNTASDIVGGLQEDGMASAWQLS